MSKTFIFILVIGISIVNAANQTVPPPAAAAPVAVAAPAPKGKEPQVCASAYKPVCGLDRNGKPVQTFSNACFAKQTDNKQVVSFVTGVCPAMEGCPECAEPVCPEPEPLFARCSEQRPQACTREYRPVCSLFDPKQVKCIKGPCGTTTANKCTACKNQNIIGWMPGSCDQYQ